MNLFYHPQVSPDDNEVQFNKEESRHIGKVLRKQVGDELFTTNGKGYLFKVILTIVSPKNCVASILSSEFNKSPNYQLHLAVAPTKLNDRYEWFLEKATEIGVSEITPIICDHSERTVIKQERYEKILQSAMKQSLKTYLPKLNEAVSFATFLQSNTPSEAQHYIAHCEETHKHLLKELVHPNTQVLICIGPEGDFSNKEIELALANNFKPISLGNSRLRTETAAIVACHSVAFINET